MRSRCTASAPRAGRIRSPTHRFGAPSAPAPPRPEPVQPQKADRSDSRQQDHHQGSAIARGLRGDGRQPEPAKAADRGADLHADQLLGHGVHPVDDQGREDPERQDRRPPRAPCRPASPRVRLVHVRTWRPPAPVPEKGDAVDLDEGAATSAPVSASTADAIGIRLRSTPLSAAARPESSRLEGQPLGDEAVEGRERGDGQHPDQEEEPGPGLRRRSPPIWSRSRSWVLCRMAPAPRKRSPLKTAWFRA